MRFVPTTPFLAKAVVAKEWAVLAWDARNVFVYKLINCVLHDRTTFLALFNRVMKIYFQAIVVYYM